MSFKSSLEGAGALGLTREVRLGELRFICFTGYSEADSQWQIGACNGVDVWRVGLLREEVIELCGSQKEAEYLEDISRTLQSGSVQLLHSHPELMLVLSCPPQQVEFSLCELSAAERKTEVRRLLFLVWDQLSDADRRVKESQQLLSEAQRQKPAEGPILQDVPLHGSKAPTRPKRKPAGHSLVNPSSKKRKAATGVVFGDEDD